MNAEIISVGCVAPYDNSVDGCLKVITERLDAAGINTRYHTIVENSASELKHDLRTAVMRSELIIIFGGIGTDSNDITISTVSSAIGMDTAVNTELAELLKQRYAESGKEVPDNFEQMAVIPSESEYFLPEGCTVPGCGVTAENQSIIMLPNDVDTVKAMMTSVLSFVGVSVSDEISEEAIESQAQAFKTAQILDDSAEFESKDDVKPAPEAPKDSAADTVLFDSAAVVNIPAVEDEASEIWEADRIIESNEKLTEIAEDSTALSETVRKPAPLVAVAKYLIPWKGDGLVEIARKVIFIIAIIGLVVSGIYVTNYFVEKFGNDKIVEDARNMYDPSDDKVDADGKLHRFDELIAQNDDCVGWLSVPNTNINNPVYQAEDNDYYINHNMLKQKSVYGALFADSRAKITKNSISKNITIYGHHMKDGTMLANVHKYKDINFYKENPVFSFDTIYGQGGKYKIFACMITNAEAKDDNGYFFDYTASDFDSDADFFSWIEQIRRRSLYITPVDVQSGDEIVTLSTCTYEIKRVELRCVLVARKVRDGESAAVNTSETSVNKKIIYPAAWYNRFGGSKPEYADGLTTWIAQPDINYIPDVDVSNLPSIDESSAQESSDAATSSETSGGGTSSSGTSTQAPSSAAASSQAPSSQAPSSQEPSSAASSQAPSSQAPSSQEPSSAASSEKSEESPSSSSGEAPAEASSQPSSEAPAASGSAEAED